MSIIDKLNLTQDYENARLETYRDYGDEKGTVEYGELGVKSVGGLPLVIKREDGKLKESFTEDTHALIIGATRSGKTTSYIIPTIFSKAHQARKDSMLVTDPKGELYRACATMLRDNGYKVILLNFRDFRHSECWNPLTPIFRKYKRAMAIEDEVTAEKTDDGYVYVYNGEKFATQSALEEFLRIEKQIMLDDVNNDIDETALGIMPTLNTSDPYWEDSARQFFTAFLYGMLEDSDPNNCDSPITEDNFSMRTILSIMGTFNYGKESSKCDNGYFTSRDESSKALQLAKEPVIANADKTRACVLSSFNAKMAVYREVVASQITSCNTFELEELVDSTRPVAVFVSYRDEVKVSYCVIQQFITAAYNKLIEIAGRRKELTLERPFYFILDEFGNLPRIKDFETTISACGGRNIWFVLVLQSYAQLYSVYGQDVGAIIKDNLNMHVFFGTNNPETKKAFSAECGLKTIVSPVSALNGDSTEVGRYEIATVPLIPVSKLNYLPVGECIVTRTNVPAVLWSKFERSYLCPEFTAAAADAKAYRLEVDFGDPKFRYTYVARKSQDTGFDW